MLQTIARYDPSVSLTLSELGIAMCEGVQNDTALQKVASMIQDTIDETPEREEYILLDVFSSFYQLARRVDSTGDKNTKQLALDMIAALWPKDAHLAYATVDKCAALFYDLGARGTRLAETIDALYQMATDLAETAPAMSYLIRRNLLDWLILGDAFFAFLDTTKTLTADLTAADPEIANEVSLLSLSLMR